jgi:adenosylcobinamide kinase/adenosylcobinamide-phosphate guanylyltransferase
LPDLADASRSSPDTAVLPLLTLVLGGARSGKSRYAERLVEARAAPALYVATGQALDDEMAERIRRHRERRGPAWTTVEAPLDLATVLGAEARPGRTILVDCLTLWLSNMMMAGRDIEREVALFLAALPELPGTLVLVANEVGLGIVPETALARAFRDHAGRLNQGVAEHAERVVFMAAGLPLTLKDVTREGH